MKSTGLGILVCLLIAGSLQVAGVEPTTRDSSESYGDAHPSIIVTQDAQKGPLACRSRRLAERLVRFTDALAAVDGQALRRVWAKDFIGFAFGAVPDGTVDGLKARSPRRAIKLLRESGGLDVRLTEIEFHVVNYEDRPADILFDGVFVPAGETSELLLHGQGTASCDSRTIFRWGMVIRSDTDSASCPPPSTPPPEGLDTLIVCTRKG